MSVDAGDSIIDIGRKWKRCPEPPLPPLDEDTVLHAKMKSNAVMYNMENKETAWLSFSGETVDIRR